ncbi:MAG TPA: hypothetical protein VIJ87_13620 [Pyrinomonadaceae bacterium]
MGRVAEAIILLGLVGGGGWLFWAGLRKSYNGVREVLNKKADWGIATVEDDDRTAIWLVKGWGKSVHLDAPKGFRYAHLIGTVDRDRDDYTERMIDLQVEAESKRDDWNNIQRALKS